MEALLDYMMQDDQIGAVCGRTHPLGNGPLVWYQIFDYAIGHWFMKVFANKRSLIFLVLT
jgi:chitin synthase